MHYTKMKSSIWICAGEPQTKTHKPSNLPAEMQIKIRCKVRMQMNWMTNMRWQQNNKDGYLKVLLSVQWNVSCSYKQVSPPPLLEYKISTDDTGKAFDNVVMMHMISEVISATVLHKTASVTMCVINTRYYFVQMWNFGMWTSV